MCRNPQKALLFEVRRTAHGETVNLFVGRPFQAVVTTKNGQFRRPEKGVLHFFSASECACYFLNGIAFTAQPQPPAFLFGASCSADWCVSLIAVRVRCGTK
jgi:hypothetical protein